MRGRSAFTLIELLVVIAIIALLVSILMPSLQKAKEMAKDIVCRSNQRSVSLAIVLYAEEHDDQYPYNTGGTGDWGALNWAMKAGADIVKAKGHAMLAEYDDNGELIPVFDTENRKSKKLEIIGFMYTVDFTVNDEDIKHILDYRFKRDPK